MATGILYEDEFYLDPDDGCSFCLRPIGLKSVCVTMGACCRNRCHYECFRRSAWDEELPRATPCPACLRKPSSRPCSFPDPGQTENVRELRRAFDVFHLDEVYRQGWLASLGTGIYTRVAGEDDALVRYATAKEDGAHLPTDYADLVYKGFRLEQLLAVFPALTADWLRGLKVSFVHMPDFARCIRILSARYGRATDIYRGTFYGLVQQMLGGHTSDVLKEYGIYGEDLLGMGLTQSQMLGLRLSPDYLATALEPVAQDLSS